ncbi:hypothetical protein, partial [Streptomyces sp. SID5910]|uniref:hypothetical protein n=1 Tax=Streptomyces sp. SID5910 TaxID=2690312 RepID=UPI0013AC6079
MTSGTAMTCGTAVARNPDLTRGNPMARNPALTRGGAALRGHHGTPLGHGRPLHRAALHWAALHWAALHWAALHRPALGRNAVGLCRLGGLGRLRCGGGPAAAAPRCLGRVRLRRGVVVGLVVRHGVVPALVGQGVAGNGRAGHRDLPRSVDGTGRVVGRPVGVGRRQGEHLTRRRLLRGGTLVRGGQGTTPAPGRPRRVLRVRLAGLRG